MTATQLVVGVLAYCLGLLFVWALVRVGASSHTGRIEQRSSKADLAANARIAKRRHADIHGRNA